MASPRGAAGDGVQGCQRYHPAPREGGGYPVLEKEGKGREGEGPVYPSQSASPACLGGCRAAFSGEEEEVDG